MSNYWTPEEIDLTPDIHDWETKLTHDEKNLLKHVLVFFLGADGLVNENLLQNFANEVQWLEAKLFYGFQYVIEGFHMETYSMFIDEYIRDADEKGRIFEGIDTRKYAM